MIRAVLDSYRQSLHLLGPNLAVHLFFRLLSLAVLIPLIGILVGITLSFSDQSALTDQDIARFLVTPAGAIGGIVVLSAMIVVVILDVAVMTALLRSGIRHPVRGLRVAAGHTLRILPRLALFAAHLLIRVILLAAPFAVFGAGVAFVLLREFDINYYLSNRPPAFQVTVAMVALTLVVLALVLIRRLSGWAVALHLVLFDGTTPSAAFRDSQHAMAGHRRGLVLRLAVWLAIRAAIGALVALVGAFAIGTIPALLSDSLGVIVAVLAVVLALWAIADTIVGAVGNGALADQLNDEFDRMLEGRAAVTDISAKETGATAFGLSGLLVAAVVAAVMLFGGLMLLDRIGPDGNVEIIAHRGGAIARPENTMAAVEQGILDGADWIEIDVQETADGRIVVVHDSDFMKAAGVPLKVWDATMEDLADIDIGSGFDPAYAAERTPLLSDVLNAARDRAKVIIELKYYGHDIALENRVIALVEAAGMEDQVATMSLSYPAVQKMRDLRPDWRTGILAATAIGDLSGLEGDFLAVSLGEVSHRLVSRARAAGKDVYAWTVNDATTMSRMISLGVDGLITDNPALAREVIAARADLTTAARLMLWLSDTFGVTFDPDTPEGAQ